MHVFSGNAARQFLHVAEHVILKTVAAFGKLFAPDVLDMPPDRFNRGRDAQGALPVGEFPQFFFNNLLRKGGLLLAALEIRVNHVAEVIDIFHRDAGQLADFRVKVAGQRDVHNQKRLGFAAQQKRLHVGARDEIAGRAGRTDDHVHAAHHFIHGVKRNRHAADFFGKRRRFVRRAIGNHHPRKAALAENAGGRLPNLARADEQHRRAPHSGAKLVGHIHRRRAD